MTAECCKSFSGTDVRGETIPDATFQIRVKFALTGFNHKYHPDDELQPEVPCETGWITAAYLVRWEERSHDVNVVDDRVAKVDNDLADSYTVSVSLWLRTENSPLPIHLTASSVELCLVLNRAFWPAVLPPQPPYVASLTEIRPRCGKSAGLSAARPGGRRRRAARSRPARSAEFAELREIELCICSMASVTCGRQLWRTECDHTGTTGHWITGHLI